LTFEAAEGIGGIVSSVVGWPAPASPLSEAATMSVVSVDTVVEDITTRLGTALGLLLLVPSSAALVTVQKHLKWSNDLLGCQKTGDCKFHYSLIANFLQLFLKV